MRSIMEVGRVEGRKTTQSVQLWQWTEDAPQRNRMSTISLLKISRGLSSQIVPSSSSDSDSSLSSPVKQRNPKENKISSPEIIPTKKPLLSTTVFDQSAQLTDHDYSSVSSFSARSSQHISQVVIRDLPKRKGKIQVAHYLKYYDIFQRYFRL